MKSALTVEQAHRESGADRRSEVLGGAERDDGEAVPDEGRAEDGSATMFFGDRNPEHRRGELRQEAATSLRDSEVSADV